MGPEKIAIVLLFLGIPALVFSVPLMLIWTYHKRKMAELQLQRQNITQESLRAEFEAIRSDIQSLRNTSMQYDLSFETALDQVNHRLNTLERQRVTTPVSAEEGVPNTLYNGR